MQRQQAVLGPRRPRHSPGQTARQLIRSVCAAGMRVSALIDTGAILALLDRRDRWHQLCVDAFGYGATATDLRSCIDGVVPPHRRYPR